MRKLDPHSLRSAPQYKLAAQTCSTGHSSAVQVLLNRLEERNRAAAETLDLSLVRKLAIVLHQHLCEYCRSEDSADLCGWDYERQAEWANEHDVWEGESHFSWLCRAQAVFDELGKKRSADIVRMLL